jgi:tRNA threonylcarbamoyladenosine biosynthesis protein TsaE
MKRILGPILLKDETATAQLAKSLATIAQAGDVFLLEGDVGAGKSYFSRQFILHLLPTPEDIPSPTFTLVQTYETKAFQIWHCDLYRLQSSDETFELGLDDAFEQDVCLIEWPDRLGPEAPKNALTLTFENVDEDRRRVTARYSHANWAKIETLFHD